MQVSLQSRIYLGTCVAINVYNAYANPVRWITAFALGVLSGTWTGRRDLYDAQYGQRPGNNLGMGWNATEDFRIRTTAVKSLANSMPGLLTTIIQLIAFGLISQRIPLPAGWDPRIGTFFCNCSDVLYGFTIGRLFHLDILIKDSDAKIQGQDRKSVV